MEQRFHDVCYRLVDLGYNYTLKPDSLLLVEKLLGDLVETTTNLRKYMKIAQQAVEESENLKFGAEPFKCDNARLVKECNELHLAFLQVKEQNEKQQRELTKQIAVLEKEKRECVESARGLRERVRVLELEAVRREDRGRKGGSAPVLMKPKTIPRGTGATGGTMPECAEAKITALCQEVCGLKRTLSESVEANDELMRKLSSRDEEVRRLMQMLQGGRPTEAINNDCCYQGINVKLLNKQDEVEYLQKVNCELECKLKEARCKQHDAMKHALCLAERNNVLEKELRDIDEMALAVEQECNTTVKNNSQKVKRYQDRMNDTMQELQRLETENHALKREKSTLLADVEATRIEKRHLQTVLEKALEDKKSLTNKLNKYAIIERDLNQEIDSLLKSSADQKLMIAEMKGRAMASTFAHPVQDDNYLTELPTKLSKKKGPTSPVRGSPIKKKTFPKRHKENKVPQNSPVGRVNMVSGSSDELDNSSVIAALQQTIKILSKEKHDLMARLEGMRDHADGTDPLGLQTSIKRLERERALLNSDITRLEEERDALKSKVKSLTERHHTEIEVLQKAVHEYDEKLRKFERERHEILQSHSSRSESLHTLERQCEDLKEKLKTSQDELSYQRTKYAQLKSLHEQTDRALSECQAKFRNAENELSTAHEKQTEAHSNSSTLSNKVKTLKEDITVLKKTLTDVENDKDKLLMQLDEKTEKIANVQAQLDLKEHKITQQEQTMSDLKSRMSALADERNAHELRMQSVTAESDRLKLELAAVVHGKDNVTLENRRLQEELAACTGDTRQTHTDLEIAQRQIEDLKHQLQHYVAEVKRIEDLMTQKEVERSEMLDQFRSLTHEATVLENNNHSLETEASQAKVQLSVALDHAGDLERHTEELNEMVRGYERQIMDSSTQVASLELQLKQHQRQSDMSNTELQSMRDILSRLESQKDELQRKVFSYQSDKALIERDLNKTRRDSEVLQNSMERDQARLDNLEMLLAQNRQESVEMRLTNQDLQDELQQLKQKNQELESTVQSATERLDMYQEKALEYSQQNKQLRRDIANDRFFHSRDDDGSVQHEQMSRISSLAFEKENAIREAAARDSMAHEAAAREMSARLESITRESMAREAAARDSAAREYAARESAVRESVAREYAARESAARDSAARESVARESAARESAARSLLANESYNQRQASKDTFTIRSTPYRDSAAFREASAVRDSTFRASPVLSAARDTLRASQEFSQPTRSYIEHLPTLPEQLPDASRQFESFDAPLNTYSSQLRNLNASSRLSTKPYPSVSSVGGLDRARSSQLAGSVRRSISPTDKSKSYQKTSSRRVTYSSNALATYPSSSKPPVVSARSVREDVSFTPRVSLPVVHDSVAHQQELDKRGVSCTCERPKSPTYNVKVCLVHSSSKCSCDTNE